MNLPPGLAKELDQASHEAAMLSRRVEKLAARIKLAYYPRTAAKVDASRSLDGIWRALDSAKEISEQ